MEKKPRRFTRNWIIAGSLIALLCCVGGVVLFVQVGKVVNAKHPWIRSLTWSPDDTYLAAGSADNSITVWDVRSAKLLQTMVKHSSYVRSLAWSPDGKLLASGGGDGSIFLWEPLTGNLVDQLLRSQDSLGYLAWSRDGSRLAYAGDTRKIMLWASASRTSTEIAQSKSAIIGIAWSPDGTRLVVSSVDGAVTVWNAQGGSPVWTAPAHKGWANAVDWASDGKLVASGGDDRQMQVWDARTGTRLHQAASLEQIYAVAWSLVAPSRLAWQSKDGEITISDFAGSDLQLRYGTGFAYSLAWAHGAQEIAAGMDDGTIHVWDSSTGKQIQLLTVPTH